MLISLIFIFFNLIEPFCIFKYLLPPFNFTGLKVEVTNNTSSDDGGEDRNPFVDWLQSILGRPTTEKPILLEPPEHCDDCS